MKKLAALTFAIATATTAFVAPAQAEHKGWYVIMGSFDYRATSAAQRRSNEVQDECGLDARWDDAIYFSGLNPNVVFVYMGPYHAKSRARAVLREAKQCVSDAYMKFGRPN